MSSGPSGGSGGAALGHGRAAVATEPAPPACHPAELAPPARHAMEVCTRKRRCELATCADGPPQQPGARE
eukprot:11091973-Lingulodinium_polyedra.AAC.1